MNRIGSTLSGSVALVLLSVGATAARGQEIPPIRDPAVGQLKAVAPQIGAHFGWTGAAGKLEGPFDLRDDLVVGSFEEDVDFVTGPFNVGAVYPFLNDQLVRPIDPNKQRLAPFPPVQGGEALGRLDIEIGNVRGVDEATGLPYRNLLFVGCMQNLAVYLPLNASDVLGGSVEIYDFNHPNFVGLPTSLIAPPDGGVAPLEVQAFGNWLAIGDVTRDGVDDLIVSAPNTKVPNDGPPLGRFYMFAGYAGFVPLLPPQQPMEPEPYPHPAWQNWVGINAPEPPAPADTWGDSFGYSIAAANLDADAAVEVLVGRPDRGRGIKVNAPQGGSAYVFRGKYLHDRFGGDSLNHVSNPPAPGARSTTEPEYQDLWNPFGMPGMQPPPMWNDAFGWVVGYADVGGRDPMNPSNGKVLGPDGILDAIVHAEGTDFIGPAPTFSPSNPQVSGGGALFVYLGVDGTSATLVDPSHVLLQRPPNVVGYGDPNDNDARFGRSFAGIKLYGRLVGQSTGSVMDGLLIGEPDGDWSGLGRTGRLYLVRYPFCPNGPCVDPADPWPTLRPASVPNAWGSTPLVGATVAVAEDMFASWVVVLNYKGWDVGAFGQQFVATTRQATVDGKFQAGKADPFIPDLP